MHKEARSIIVSTLFPGQQLVNWQAQPQPLPCAAVIIQPSPAASTPSDYWSCGTASAAHFHNPCHRAQGHRCAHRHRTGTSAIGMHTSRRLGLAGGAKTVTATPPPNHPGFLS